VLAGTSLPLTGAGSEVLKTEIDTAGGSSYLLMGVTQFMSVPYALYANATKPTYVSLEYPDGLLNLQKVTVTSGAFILFLPEKIYMCQVCQTISA